MDTACFSRVFMRSSAPVDALGSSPNALSNRDRVVVTLRAPISIFHCDLEGTFNFRAQVYDVSKRPSQPRSSLMLGVRQLLS